MIGPSVMNFTRPAKNGRSRVHGVESLAPAPRVRRVMRSARILNPALLEHGENLARVARGYGVRFDD